ncbi:hypothetical protein BMA1294 [Burkholderia mallei ATCC 23344]|uniref:Uncharacterized protein n=1 Tax=Burkholderia mallei (strain ATCC 23344) TaxID=243160 RepID=A0A0H2WF64_BURMA|nr:hypothetical protein BMA1294 [Burkholderia mallei ATCC 23344]
MPRQSAIRAHALIGCERQAAGSLLAIVLNSALRSVPTVPTVVAMATAIRPAINPYSIAVTPASSLKKR